MDKNFSSKLQCFSLGCDYAMNSIRFLVCSLIASFETAFYENIAFYFFSISKNLITL